jgi:hypothetical protein
LIRVIYLPWPLSAQLSSPESDPGTIISFRIESVPPGDFLLSIWVFGPAVGRPAETEKVCAPVHTRIEVNPSLDERSEEPQSLGTINLRTNTRNP